MLARIGCMDPWDGRFEGIFCGLFREATKTPFFGLAGLESFQLLEEITFEGTNIGMRGTWMERGKGTDNGSCRVKINVV